MAEATDPRVGSEVAGYRLDRLIGRGGTSVVYAAEHLALGRPAALKVLSLDLAEDPRFRERFLRESRTAAAIDHPNIVPIYEAGQADGLLYIAMRLIEGTDLRALLREEGPLEPGRAVDIVEQVARALDAAHAQGLVHRDVKPANILLEREQEGIPDHAYLADFGLTKHLTAPAHVTATGGLIGTLHYVAPEQITGEGGDRRSDVYGLGCVLHECLTGEVPFERGSELAVLWAHVNDPPPSAAERRPGLPPAVDRVIACALAKDPAERFASCGDLAAAAREALVGGTPRGVRRRRPRRAVLLGGSAAAVAAVVAAVLLLRAGTGGGDAPTVLAANSVGRIDATQNRIVGEAPVGRRPTRVVVGAGAVWVANARDRTVSRLDEATGRVDATIPVGATPTDLAFGEGFVWVASGFDGRLARIDPATNRLRSVPIDGGPQSVAAGLGAAWVADATNERLVRVDPGTLRTQAIELGGGAIAVAVADGAVWVADDLGRRLVRVDPATRRRVAVALREAPDRLAAGPGAVWATSNEADALYRVDTQTNRVAATVPVPDGPAGVAVGAGAVWVASATAGTVSRVDPASDRVTAEIPVGTEDPEGIAAGGNGVWVSVHGP